MVDVDELELVETLALAVDGWAVVNGVCPAEVAASISLVLIAHLERNGVNWKQYFASITESTATADKEAN